MNIYLNQLITVVIHEMYVNELKMSIYGPLYVPIWSESDERRNIFSPKSVKMMVAKDKSP